jgi:hypothetical protein
MAKSTHKGLHKYKKMTIGQNKTVMFKCMKDGCPHYMPNAMLALGNECECWNCGAPVTITMYTIAEVVKPICDKCKVVRKMRRERMKQIA